MGDGNYLGELLAARREAPTPGIFTGLQQGLGLGQDIKAVPYNNALMNYGTQEIQRKQQEQTALKQAMQTGDVKALMGINPQMAREVGKVQDWYKTQSDPVQKDIGRLTESLPTIAPMLNSKSWGALRPQLLKNYPNVPESALPPPNATDQQLDMWANHAAFLAAQLKQAGQRPVSAGGSVWDPSTNSWTTPPPKPMSEVEQARLNETTRHHGVEEGYRGQEVGMRGQQLFDKELNPSGQGKGEKPVSQAQAMNMARRDWLDYLKTDEGKDLKPAEQEAARSAFIKKRAAEYKSGGGAQAEGEIPPEAKAHLQEGQNTQFGNGQTWTLQGGQPVRVY